MNIQNIKPLFFKLLFFMLVGCIEPYVPEAIDRDIRILVVDGFLNTTAKTVTVNLSRTLPIYSDTPYTKEEHATVFLEDENNVRQTLIESTPGFYAKDNLILNTSRKYRIYLITEDNEEYYSQYISLKQTPSLDNISWVGLENGVQVYVDAHDQTNQTRYYQWKFAETWQYTANYFANIKVEDDNILFKTAEELTYACYKTEVSNQILIESTTHLSEDVVNDFPVLMIPKGSTKLANRYSVLIQQRALDADAYNYLLQLKKTTETMGGLFDPLPSQLVGNIYNANNSSDAVIGYFMGGSVQEKRLFINYNQLPQHLRGIDYPPGFCPIDTVSTAEIISLYPDYQIIEGYPQNSNLDPHEFNFFLITTQYCTDCRLSDNGILTKPDFW